MAFDMGSAASGAGQGFAAGGVYGAIAGGIIGGFSGGKAKKKAKKAAKAAAAAQREYGLQLQKLAPEVQGKIDPFNKYRAEIAQKLSNIVMGRESFTSDPGYQFRLDEANREVERAAAARGYNKSGNIMAAITQRTQDVASQEYQNVISRLTELGGAYASNAVAGGQAYGEMMGTGLGAQYGANQQYSLFKGQQAQQSHENLMSAFSSFGSSGGLSKIGSIFGGGSSIFGGSNVVTSRGPTGGTLANGQTYKYI